MKRSALCIALFLLTAVIAPLRADSSALTLTQCTDTAVQFSAALQAGAQRLRQAGYRTRQVRGARLPDVSVTGTRGWQNARAGSDLTDAWRTRLSASQPVFAGFGLSSAYREAKQLEQSERSNQQTIIRDLKTAVAAAFYTVAQIESDAANTQISIDILQKRLAELKDRVRLGKSNLSEMTTIESQIASAMAQQEKLKGDHAAALEDLGLLVGLPAETLVIADAADAPQSAGLPGEYLAAAEQRSDIAALRCAVQAQISRVGIARGAFLPAIDLSGTWDASRAGFYASDTEWQALLAFSLPLYQGGMHIARYNEEKARLDESLLVLKEHEREVTAEVRKRWAALNSSLNQARTLRDAYDKAEKSYRMQEKDYRLGLVNNLDVLQALGVMIDTKRNLDRAVIGAKLNRELLTIAANVLP